MKTDQPITINNKIVISARVNDLGSAIEIRIASAANQPLSRQQILDVVSDYLLLDPRGLFDAQA